MKKEEIPNFYGIPQDSAQPIGMSVQVRSFVKKHLPACLPCTEALGSIPIKHKR